MKEYGAFVSVALSEPAVWLRPFAILLGVLLLPAAAQNQQAPSDSKPIGWINGKPVSAERFKMSRYGDDDMIFVKYGRAPAPADEPEIAREREKSFCSRWETLFDVTVYEEAFARYAITLSDAEVREFKSRMPVLQNPAAEAARLREKGIRLRAALEAVHVQKRDPQEIYDATLRPIGVGDVEWNLLRFQGREEPRRSNLTRWMIEMTTEAYVASIKRSDIAAPLRFQKLQSRVVADAKKAGIMPATTSREEEERYYYNWKLGQRRNLKVTLADPSIAKRCGFAKMGVEVPGAPQ